MASIGPQIPAHLLQRAHSESDDENAKPKGSIGPAIPAHLSNSGSGSGSIVRIWDEDGDGPKPTSGTSGVLGPTFPPEFQQGRSRPAPQEESDEDDIGPALPSSSSSKRALGPTLPTYAPTYNPHTYPSNMNDSDSDDDIGPQPLPAGMQHAQTDAVKEFMEREEKRRKAAEEASKPKAAKRDEWMLVPPTSSGLLGNLDPTKLKPRQFRATASSAPPSSKEPSLWTETPAERQQRLADEVLGKKRKVTDVKPEEDSGKGDEKKKKRRRREEEERIREGVESHTRTHRGPALVDQHSSQSHPSASEDKDKPPGIWDHSRDMGLGGRLMDDDKRNKMLKEAKGLGDRFGAGKGGGFL